MIKFTRLLLPVLCTGVLASCLNDNNTTTAEVQPPIISNLVLGNLKATATMKTAAGKDSTYAITIAGSAYPFYIDQLNRQIYTADSLPYGTNVRKVVFSALTATGSVVINKLSEAGDTTFLMTDSTDFSKVRTLKVFSADGTESRSYQVNVLVHKEIGDSTTWNNYTSTTLASTAVKRAFVDDDKLTVFAMDGAVPVVLTAAKGAPEAWTRVAIAQNNIDLRSIQRLQGVYYALGGGVLMSSTDGSNWGALASNATPTALAMGGDERLIGVVDGQLYGTADGITWEVEPVTNGDDVLPTANFAGSVQTMPTDATLKDYLLIGEANGAMVAWKRTIDTTGGETYPWVNYPASSTYALPLVSDASLMPYGNGSVLIGMQGGVPSALYWSRDNGRTWRPNLMTKPATLTGTSVVGATDADHFIWLFAGGSGQVWRGRVNSVSWGTAQKTWTNAPRLVQ